jgi:ABC-type bacteriocin/lantibiotic exporter with double-glycine peptidase domain
MGVKASFGALLLEPLPAIAYINDSHYVVVNEVTPSAVYVFDTAIGHVKLSRQTFEQAWKGYLLLIRMRQIKPSLDALTDVVPTAAGIYFSSSAGSG